MTQYYVTFVVTVYREFFDEPNSSPHEGIYIALFPGRRRRRRRRRRNSLVPRPLPDFTSQPIPIAGDNIWKWPGGGGYINSPLSNCGTYTQLAASVGEFVGSCSGHTLLSTPATT